jgi:serine/threonine protein kinase
MLERNRNRSPSTPRKASPAKSAARHPCFPNVRLIDFGHAQYIDPAERTPGAFGTPEYAAPEVFARAENELVWRHPAGLYWNVWVFVWPPTICR